MEILNIDYNVKRLVLKALNSSSNNNLARIKLGISERTMYNYMHRYHIKLNRKTHEYEENIPRGSITAEVRRDEGFDREF